MYERLQNLSLQVLIIGLSILVLKVYLKILTNWIKKQPYDNIEWLKQNRMKLYFLVNVPLTLILAPTFEEFFFRLPLIVIFGDVSGNAWLGILVSAVLFGAIHYLNPSTFYVGSQILDAGKDRGQGAKFNDVAKEIVTKEKKTILWAKLSQVVTTFFLGLISGYYGIKYQSLFVSVGLHAAWNLFMPFILMIIAIIVALLVAVPTNLVTTYLIRRRLRKGLASLGKR